MGAFFDAACQCPNGHIVELGCGDGMSASEVMRVLGDYGHLTCVNWPNPPSGDDPRRYLTPWLSDPRLRLVFGDTCDQELADTVPDCIDLLYIDSTHTRECAEAEWRLWRPKLAARATVIIDDLDHNDMMDFWGLLHYDKQVVTDGRVGIVHYERYGA